MSMLGAILEGGLRFSLPEGSFWMAVPKWALNVVSNQKAFKQVTLGVWPKKAIITVEADGLQRGWFPVVKLRKSRDIVVTNYMHGVEPMKLALTAPVHGEVGVWLDQMEERGHLRGPNKLAERELVRADPRVDSMDQEQDGFCDDTENWGRRAWWVYLTETWIDDDMGCGTIHECNLKKVLDHLQNYVRPRTPEEMEDDI